MTCDTIWKREQVRPDPATDHEGVPRCATMAIRLNVTNITTSRPKTTDEPHPSYVTTWPNIEVLHTPLLH